MMFAVCSACVPEPTRRLISGCGMPSCSKKPPDISFVVVLAGMDQAVAQVSAICPGRLDRVDDGRDLHEIRTGARDEIDELCHTGTVARISGGSARIPAPLMIRE